MMMTNDWAKGYCTLAELVCFSETNIYKEQCNVTLMMVMENPLVYLLEMVLHYSLELLEKNPYRLLISD